MHHLELISQLLDHPKNWLRSYSKVPELYEVIQKLENINENETEKR